MAERRKPVYDNYIQELIQSPLEEGLIPLFLTNIAFFLDSHTIPTAKHTQILLHYASLPTKYEHPSPLSLLYRLSDRNPPHVFAQLLPYPSHDSSPRWLSWTDRRGAEKDAKSRLALCKREGIWALVFDKSTNMAESEGRQRSISPHGWAFMEWFVQLWESDIPADQPTAVSKSFILQLPRGAADLQLDDAALPLDVVRAAYTSKESPSSSGIHRSVATRLLRLLVNSATGPSPPFHPQSLVLSLMKLFRSFSPTQVSMLLSDMQRTLPWNVFTYVTLIAIEDMGGVRIARAEARSRRKSKKRKMDEDEVEVEDLIPGEGFGIFQPPTMAYLVEGVLPLPLGKGVPVSTDRVDTLARLKTSLLSGILRQGDNRTAFQTAVKSTGPDWDDRVKSTLEAPEGDPKADSLLPSGIMLQDIIKTIV